MGKPTTFRLRPGGCCVMFNDEKRGYEIVIPKDDDAEIPPAALALLACGMRLTKDEAFADEMRKWFHEKVGS